MRNAKGKGKGKGKQGKEQGKWQISMREKAIEEWYNENCINKNNNAWITGMIMEEFKYSHKGYNGETYSYTMVGVKGKTGILDFVKVVVPNTLLAGRVYHKGMYIDVKGKMCSHRYEQVKKPTNIYLLAQKICFYNANKIGNLANINATCLSGYICKDPYRGTIPTGKKRTSFILAVSNGNKLNYIPCVAWKNDARRIASLNVGDNVKLFGRMQSREYIKILENGKEERRTAYEMSIIKIIDILF